MVYCYLLPLDTITWTGRVSMSRCMLSVLLEENNWFSSLDLNAVVVIILLYIFYLLYVVVCCHYSHVSHMRLLQAITAVVRMQQQEQ